MSHLGQQHIFRFLLDYFSDFVIIFVLTGAVFVSSFPHFSVFLVSSYLSHDRSQLRMLLVGMVKSTNMAENKHKVTHKGHLVMKP